MPIDWNAVQKAPGTVPDTSVLRGTLPDPLPNAKPGVPAGVGSGVGAESLPPVQPLNTKATPENIPYTPDYSILEGISAGLKDTAISALWYAAEEPDFDFDSTFDPGAVLSYTEQSIGRSFDDNDKELLLRTGSKDEFEHQLQRIFEHDEMMEVAQQEMLGYLAGSLADYDTVVGGAVGAVPKVAKLSRLARLSARGGTTAAASAAGYELDTYTPLSPAEIAFMVSVVSAGGMLGDFFKPKGKGAERPTEAAPAPAADPATVVPPAPEVAPAVKPEPPVPMPEPPPIIIKEGIN